MPTSGKAAASRIDNDAGLWAISRASAGMFSPVHPASHQARRRSHNLVARRETGDIRADRVDGPGKVHAQHRRQVR